MHLKKDNELHLQYITKKRVLQSGGLASVKRCDRLKEGYEKNLQIIMILCYNLCIAKSDYLKKIEATKVRFWR